MLGRKTTGSTICRSCNQLVGVKDDQCLNCGARYPALFGYAHVLRDLGADLGFVRFVIGTCALLFVVALLIGSRYPNPEGWGRSGIFGLLSPSIDSSFLLGASGPYPIFNFQRWWTLLSAGWLHGGLLHIVFNMMWVRQLAPPVAHLYGAGRMVIIYILSSVAGFALSLVGPLLLPFPIYGLTGGNFSLGASAALLGLLGALVHYGRRGSAAVGKQAWTYAVVLIVFGFVMPGVDNWAHLGGFGGGYLVAMILNPLKPERINHLLLAVLLIALSVISVILSVATGLSAIPLPKG